MADKLQACKLGRSLAYLPTHSNLAQLGCRTESRDLSTGSLSVGIME